jgi:hypothetical protein
MPVVRWWPCGNGPWLFTATGLKSQLATHNNPPEPGNQKPSRFGQSQTGLMAELQGKINMNKPYVTAEKWFYVLAWAIFVGMIATGWFNDHHSYYFSGMVAALISVATMFGYQQKAPDSGVFNVMVLFWSGISLLPVIIAVM